MNGLNAFTSAPINMKYKCKKCNTEFKETRQPIVVCQACGMVQLVPYSYRPNQETHSVKYETRRSK